MNTRRTQQDIPRTPKNTNLAGGRGCGSIPALGRRTFIDELVTRSNSSIGSSDQELSSVRRIPISPRVEASVSKVEKTVGSATPSTVPVEGILGYRSSYVGAGGPEVVYHIDEKEVTEEDCL